MQSQVSCKKTDPFLIRFCKVNALQLLLCTLKYNKKLNFNLRIDWRQMCHHVVLWCGVKSVSVSVYNKGPKMLTRSNPRPLIYYMKKRVSNNFRKNFLKNCNS